MPVVLDTKININSLMQGAKGTENLRLIFIYKAEDIRRGIHKREDFFFDGEIDAGDLSAIFGFKISENPLKWALVWIDGYNTQLSLYADTYTERHVETYAALGLMALMQNYEGNTQASQAANLIMNARDKALALVKSLPVITSQDRDLVSKQLEDYKSTVNQEAAILEGSVKEFERKQREELEAYKRKVSSEIGALKESISEENLEAKRLELSYTKEQRKANKARASAIRLKARTMSFVDKRSIR